MPASQKKVILRRLDGESIFGYLPPAGFVSGDAVTLLDPEGRLSHVPLSELQAIFFVRDFNRGDTGNPERLLRRTFAGRPRGEGLWVRFALRPNDDAMEGLAPLDANLLDDLLTDAGLQIAPPDTRSNTQRIYIPRAAIAAFQILAVITSPSRRKAPSALPPAETQPELFAELSSLTELRPRKGR